MQTHVIYYENRQFEPKPKKLILIWTRMFFKWEKWKTPMKMLDGCRKTNNCSCEMTLDTNRIVEADAVIFHCMDLMPWLTMPRYRHPRQVWILWCAEPPTHIWNSLSGYRMTFNWTMYYRRDSTIFAPYSRIRKLTDKEPRPNIADVLKHKNKGIVIMNSNCFDDIHRYRILYELQKHLNFDYYGDCGNLTCARDDPICNNQLMSDYKFSIRMENCYCRDYVTEKYYEALINRQLPIVNWKKTQIVPQVIPHSYINIKDFPSIRDAAKYIEYVNKNDSLYLSYFAWRKEYRVQGGLWDSYCTLCSELHNASRPAQTIVDLNAWFVDDNCPKASIGVGNSVDVGKSVGIINSVGIDNSVGVGNSVGFGNSVDVENTVSVSNSVGVDNSVSDGKSVSVTADYYNCARSSKDHVVYRDLRQFVDVVVLRVASLFLFMCVCAT
ncbi:hypothetical protein FSP39_019755 [Pinctada imbricata]|uniref:Fucosyltransferase n=1 Tax=Pinctada imbricata TaxID=66713 RepID=A0AA89BV44_PINIB|nr:hypothetical protein FSP39_019755 [Pinctada imbricata]